MRADGEIGENFLLEKISAYTVVHVHCYPCTYKYTYMSIYLGILCGLVLPSPLLRGWMRTHSPTLTEVYYNKDMMMMMIILPVYMYVL